MPQMWTILQPDMALITSELTPIGGTAAARAQSMPQTWTVLQHDGPNHLGTHTHRGRGSYKGLVHTANVDEHPTLRPESPRIVVK